MLLAMLLPPWVVLEVEPEEADVGIIANYYGAIVIMIRFRIYIGVSPFFCVFYLELYSILILF
jgi:hypothetical protein